MYVPLCSTCISSPCKSLKSPLGTLAGLTFPLMICTDLRKYGEIMLQILTKNRTMKIPYKSICKSYIQDVAQVPRKGPLKKAVKINAE